MPPSRLSSSSSAIAATTNTTATTATTNTTNTTATKSRHRSSTLRKQHAAAVRRFGWVVVSLVLMSIGIVMVAYLHSQSTHLNHLAADLADQFFLPPVSSYNNNNRNKTKHDVNHNNNNASSSSFRQRHLPPTIDSTESTRNTDEHHHNHHDKDIYSFWHALLQPFYQDPLSSSNNSNSTDDDDYYHLLFSLLPTWLQEYIRWHDQMRRLYPDIELWTHPNAPHILIRYCVHKCGGLQDRLGSIPTDLYLAHRTKRIYAAHKDAMTDDKKRHVLQPFHWFMTVEVRSVTSARI